MDLAVAVYRFTRGFPRSELFGLTSQLRRAASSVPCNIAEGYGRRTRNEYVHQLSVGYASLQELETLLLLSSRVGLLIPAAALELHQRCTSTGKLLNALIRSLRDSERQPVGQTPAPRPKPRR